MAELSSPLARLAAFRAELHAAAPAAPTRWSSWATRCGAPRRSHQLPTCAWSPSPARLGSADAALARGRIDAESSAPCWPATRDRTAAYRSTPSMPPPGALRRQLQPRARRTTTLAALGRPADRGRLVLPVDRPAQLPSRQLDRAGGRPPPAPARHHNQVAVAQIRALLARLPASGQAPLLVFDAGYHPTGLGSGLAEAPAAILVRLRSGRCCDADPPPRWRPARAAGHAATAPSWTPATRPPGRRRRQATQRTIASTVACRCRPGPGCTQAAAAPTRGPSGHARAGAAPWSASRSSACLPPPARPSCCGGGGTARRSGPRHAVARPRAPLRPGTHHPVLHAGPGWATPRPATPPRPTGGPGWCWPATPSYALPAAWSATGGCRGSGPAQPVGSPWPGSPRVSRNLWRSLAPRPARRNPAGAPQAGPGQPRRTRPTLPDRQERQEGRLTATTSISTAAGGPPRPTPHTRRVKSQAYRSSARWPLPDDDRIAWSGAGGVPARIGGPLDTCDGPLRTLGVRGVNAGAGAAGRPGSATWRWATRG
jgi:hypothetical protein